MGSCYIEGVKRKSTLQEIPKKEKRHGSENRL